MLPAANKGAGMNIGFPDVCLTPAPPGPPVPIPYPNFALNAVAVPFSITVKVSGVNALNMGSEMPMTQGDEPGVANVTIKGPGRYTIGNVVVLVEGLPAANALLPTTGNNMNDGLGAAVVPSVVNVFFTHAGAPAGSTMDLAAARSLAASVASTCVPAEASRSGSVACLEVPVFSTAVPARVFGAVARLGALDALILDLRGCPGGELHAAVELAGDFLDEGMVVVTAVDGDGDETVHRARRPRRYRFPLFLLVDALTASAAEVFAGCLKAHGRAVIVGERTYGKGTAQRIVPAPAGPGATYGTVAELVLPDGQPLDGHGVVPDVEAPPDGALDAARAAITSLLSSKEVR